MRKDGENKNDVLLSAFFLGGIAIFIIFVIFGDVTKALLLKMNYYTLGLIYFVIRSTNVLATIRGIEGIYSVHEVPWDDVWYITAFTGSYMRYVVCPTVLFSLFYLYKKDPKFKYRRILNIKNLLNKNAKHFYSVRPIVGENLLSKESYRNHWRPMISPFEFALENNLFVAEENKEQEKINKEALLYYKKRKISGESVISEHKLPSINIDKLRLIFEKQLGRIVWDKESNPKTKKDIVNIYKNFKPHEKGLLTVFLCHYIAEGKMREEGDRFLEQFANSFYFPDKTKKEKILGILKKEKRRKKWDLQSLDTNGIDQKFKEILKKTDEDVLLQLFSCHAWSNTLLVSIYDRVKTVVTADFIWLKPTDRPLWYVLNSVGRKTYPCEAAGVFAHYFTENALRRPLKTPDVDSAIKAYIEYMRMEYWIS